MILIRGTSISTMNIMIEDLQVVDHEPCVSPSYLQTTYLQTLCLSCFTQPLFYRVKRFMFVV